VQSVDLLIDYDNYYYNLFFILLDIEFDVLSWQQDERYGRIQQMCI